MTFPIIYFSFAKPKWNSLPYQCESQLALYNSFYETKELLSQRTIILDFITNSPFILDFVQLQIDSLLT